MEEITIGEISRRAGIRASALRYYERVGILPAPRRVNGRRRYEASTLQQIAAIQVAKEAEFTVAQIGTLFQGFAANTPLSERWRSLARAKLEELDMLRARMERMRNVLERGLRCGCVNLEDCDLLPDARCDDIPQPADR